MEPDPAPPLGGEADPNSWHFQHSDDVGPLPNPVGHTFPLLTHDLDGRWRLAGTGFYVSEDGLFVTVRHVIDQVIINDEQALPLIILHLTSPTSLFGASEVLYRPITQAWLGNECDVAFGEAASATNKVTGEKLRHWCWPLSWSCPAVGAEIGTYAFPRHKISEDGTSLHLAPELYPGRVTAVGDCRDRIMIPFPYLEVDCRVHGAASGGPIAVSGGAVVGINCTELAQTIDHPPGPAFAAQVRCLQEAFLEGITFADETTPRRVGFDEFVARGFVSIASHIPKEPGQPSSGHVIRLDRIPATAPHPALNLTQYA